MNSRSSLTPQEIQQLVKLPREKRLGALLEMNDHCEFDHRIDVIKLLREIDMLSNSVEKGRRGHAFSLKKGRSVTH